MRRAHALLLILRGSWSRRHPEVNAAFSLEELGPHFPRGCGSLWGALVLTLSPASRFPCSSCTRWPGTEFPASTAALGPPSAEPDTDSHCRGRSGSGQVCAGRRRGSGPGREDSPPWVSAAWTDLLCSRAFDSWVTIRNNPINYVSCTQSSPSTGTILGSVLAAKEAGKCSPSIERGGCWAEESGLSYTGSAGRATRAPMSTPDL